MNNTIQGGGGPFIDNRVKTGEVTAPQTGQVNRRPTDAVHGTGRPTALPDARARMETAIPRTTLAGRRGRPGLPEAFNAFKGKLQAFFNKFKKTTLANLNPTIKLTVDGQERNFDSRILNMKIPIGSSVATLTARIQEKIDRGAELFEQVTSGSHQGGCTDQNMTDLAWYLQAKCESKSGDQFRDGAMTLPDPLTGKRGDQNRQARLLNFLDSHAKSYQRESTHLNKFQRMGHAHRGIDARGTNASNLDNVLPYGLKTMLYGRIPESETGKNRLFVKLEVFGCPSLNKLVMGIKHTPWDTKGPQGNFRRSLADFMQTLGHLTTSIFGNPKLPKGTNQLTARKERVPEQLKLDYTELVDKIKSDFPDSPLKDQVIKQLNGDGPLDKSSGIKTMTRNMNLAFNLVRNEIGKTGTQRSSEQTYMLDDMAERILTFNQTKISSRYDNAHLRFGNEIIFTENDLPGY